MGRRAYLNRLALGRSPYEAPERPTGSSADQANLTTRRTSAVHSDGYIQHYDERGHPINPESKTFGRELRRAKNDILSTMGIVVSEEGNRGRHEQEKIDAIVAENDYGLVMVTLDQISVFLGSWWTTSLTGRIQTFRSYAHVPLTSIINHERASLGTIGFYFAGVPAWAVSTCLSICRHHPLERLVAAVQNRFPNNDAASKLVRASFTVVHSAARGVFLVMAMQTYMYSLLQSLHLIHPASLPGAGLFLPFGRFALMQLPQFPLEFSFRSVSAFIWDILKTPSLFYIYVYLRPLVEVRLYRLIRRRLPKPSLTDDLSIKVAYDNDLIDWMVPTLGRRAVEETQRSGLSLMDDLLYEVQALRRWVSSKLPFKSKRVSHVSRQIAGQSQGQVAHEHPNIHEHAESGRSGRPAPVSGPDTHASNAGNRSLSDETNPHSSVGFDNGDYSDMSPLRRARSLPLATGMSPLPSPGARQDGISGVSRRHSRSDTLLSRSPSPTSSQSSPRVRAQLIEDTDVIAMQLELESRRPNGDGHRNARAADESDRQNPDAERAGRRSISDFIDSLISSQGQNLTTIINSESTDSDGLSHMTMGVSPEVGGMTPRSAFDSTPNEQPPTAEPAATNVVDALPDVVQEPPGHDPDNRPSLEDDLESDIFPHMSEASVRHGPAAGNAGTPVTAHRVTILSSLPVDSLASHLASMVTTVLFAPLESFYLRSLASSYLSSAGAPASLRSDVYGLGVWCGGRSRSDMLAYMGKLALMMGMQAAVNASVWGIVSGTAIKIGRRWCGWGSL